MLYPPANLVTSGPILPPISHRALGEQQHCDWRLRRRLSGWPLGLIGSASGKTLSQRLEFDPRPFADRVDQTRDIPVAH
jgi:hypothetical protein